MKTRHARDIRAGIHLARGYMSPYGNVWWARAAFASNALTIRAFEHTMENHYRKDHRART